MIECDGCNDWFHPKCVGIPEKDADKVKHWKCVLCTGDRQAPAAPAPAPAPAPTPVPQQMQTMNMGAAAPTQMMNMMRNAMPTPMPAQPMSGMSAMPGISGMPMPTSMIPSRDMSGMASLSSAAASMAGHVPSMHLASHQSPFHPASLPPHMAFSMGPPAASQGMSAPTYGMGNSGAESDGMQMDNLGMMNWGWRQ
jgi:hypothetical protein